MAPCKMHFEQSTNELAFELTGIACGSLCRNKYQGCIVDSIISQMQKIITLAHISYKLHRTAATHAWSGLIAV